MAEDKLPWARFESTVATICDKVRLRLEPGLALGDELRLEAAGPVAWDRDVDLAILGPRAVAAVAAAAPGGIALLVAKVLGQLRPKRTLNQCLLELLEKTIVASQVFGFS